MTESVTQNQSNQEQIPHLKGLTGALLSLLRSPFYFLPERVYGDEALPRLAARFHLTPPPTV